MFRKKCYLQKKTATERLNFWGRESGWVMEIYHFFITIAHPSTVEPRFNEVAGDRPNLFVKGTVSQTAHVQVINQKWSDVFKFVICEAKWRQQAEDNLYSHEGRKNNSGRKKFFFNSGSGRKQEREESRRRIRLEQNIYKSWLLAKLEATYSSTSNSEFAMNLLSLENRRR